MNADQMLKFSAGDSVKVEALDSHEKLMAKTPVKESIGSLVSHARSLLGEAKSKLVDLKPIVGDLKAKVYALSGMVTPEMAKSDEDTLSNVNVFTNFSDKRIAVMYNTRVPGTKTKDQTRAIADLVATFAKANNLTVKFEADWGEKARPKSPGEVVWSLTQ